MLPDQAKRVILASLADGKSTSDVANLHLDPDAIFCIAEGGFHSSTFLIRWELEERVLVPPGIAKMIAGKGSEVAFCIAGNILVLSIDGLHVATPQVGSDGLSADRSDLLKKKWFQVSGSGVTSSNLTTELDVAILQSDGNDRILLWTNDERSSDLHFFSPGSEVGNNSGSLWSNLTNFKICVDPVLMRRLVPTNDMWEMSVISYTGGGMPVLMVKEESGVHHHLMSKAATGNHDEYFQKIIDEFDYKEQVNEGE
jgi:hypothetical protein